MRYHFNIRDGVDILPDEEGSEFATLHAARAEARASLLDLAVEDMRNGKPVHGLRVEIATCEGTVLDSIGILFSEDGQTAPIN